MICLAASSPPEEGSTKKELLLLKKEEGPSTDPKLIFNRFWAVASPYWMDSEEATQARLKLAGVTALTLGTTGVSVLFNFLGRDFFNYLSEKDVANFYLQLQKYLAAFAIGIPIFVLRDYYLVRYMAGGRGLCCRRPPPHCRRPPRTTPSLTHSLTHQPRTYYDEDQSLPRIAPFLTATSTTDCT